MTRKAANPIIRTIKKCMGRLVTDRGERDEVKTDDCVVDLRMV